MNVFENFKKFQILITLIFGLFVQASNLTAYPTISCCTIVPVSSDTRCAKEIAATLLDSQIPI